MFQLLYSIFESWWRRYFGGGYIGGDSKKDKWYNIRAFQHILAILITIPAIYFLNPKTEVKYFIGDLIPAIILPYLIYFLPIYIAAIKQGLYWARAHGPGFDIGYGGKPDAKLIERYKKEWWNKICEWLVPVDDWYRWGYDMLWMGFRYTACLLLLVPIYGFSILFLGILVPFIYSACWSLYGRKRGYWESKLFKKLQIDGPTALAEYLVGFVTGLFIILL